MEQELRGALDRGEFELYYQPVVTAADGTLNGFEALIRWHNKTLGNVSPGRFIPLAEDSRLISPIGEWVLHTACHEAMKWPSNLKVAVNVSAEQLTDPAFASVVVSALAQSGLTPQRLEIEVTESVFLRDGGGAAQLLDQLIGLGIRLSLDDFGTGYSSLGYLRKTQFSTIKVDRSFVVGAAKGSIESIRSEEHTSELQSLMRISYAVFCLKKKNIVKPTNIRHCLATLITNLLTYLNKS